MNCLNEYQLECLLKNKGGIMCYFWGKHVERCIICKERYDEISNNVDFLKGVLSERKKHG